MTFSTEYTPATIAALLAEAINAANFDVHAIASPNSHRVTLVDPTPDSNGQFGQVDAFVTPGNGNRISSEVPEASVGIRIDGGFGEAPVLQAVDGGRISDGQTFEINTANRNLPPVTFEFESGFVLDVPQTFAIQVPVGGGRVIYDGESFSIDPDINDAFQLPITFELENTDVGDGFGASHVPIFFDGRTSQDELADRIAVAVKAAIGTTQPGNRGEGFVHLGVTGIEQLDASQSTSLTQLGQRTGISDEESFRLGNGTFTRIFEFDNNGKCFGGGAGDRCEPEFDGRRDCYEHRDRDQY